MESVSNTRYKMALRQTGELCLLAMLLMFESTLIVTKAGPCYNGCDLDFGFPFSNFFSIGDVGGHFPQKGLVLNAILYALLIFILGKRYGSRRCVAGALAAILAVFAVVSLVFRR